MMDKKFCVLIPAYNEELNIQQVIREIRGVDKNLQIIVIDDGSTDNTAGVAKSEKAIVLKQEKNLGSGEALKAGFKYALFQRYQYLLRLDADGQHNPTDIPKLMKALIKDRVDLVIGSRFIKKTKYRIPVYRLVCIKIIALIYRYFYGFMIADPTSGYRGYNRKTARFLLDHYQSAYPEANSFASLIFNHFKIKEVSSAMRPRLHGKSSIHLIKGFYFFLLIVSKIIIYRFKKKELN